MNGRYQHKLENTRLNYNEDRTREDPSGRKGINYRKGESGIQQVRRFTKLSLQVRNGEEKRTHTNRKKGRACMDKPGGQLEEPTQEREADTQKKRKAEAKPDKRSDEKRENGGMPADLARTECKRDRRASYP